MEHIKTHARLQEIAIAKLGEMDEGRTYQGFMTLARRLAAQKGISNPTLMLSMKYRPGILTGILLVLHGQGMVDAVDTQRPFYEVIHQIRESEWDEFVRDSDTYLVENPGVWAVDGDLYSAIYQSRSRP